jgi:hypothetical protein
MSVEALAGFVLLRLRIVSSASKIGDAEFVADLFDDA